MNEQERVNILQRLSSGEISAEKAARLLSGEIEPTTVVEVAMTASPADVAIAVDEAPSPVQALEVVVKIDDAPKKVANAIRFRALDDSGQLDIDLVIPVSLLKLGQQIGERFAPTLNGWDWNTLDLDLNLDTLKVRVSAE
jgi:hypothetical protein